ncbi:hypothetical protein [Salegentibacter sp. Hel_I_6]|uniref:hypothetical protein n=1 Tax=Salegentibacter sp. Hel_I_6 TaxID=1250278 RepID=UPI00068F4693|nr:hypothetical protein [Salegentibacter sp. Hel_I_6]
MIELQTPTNDLVDKYIDQFNNDERYYPADQAIINLFDAFPDNKKLEDILLKLSVINDLYSTNILGTFKMAKHIQQCDIDKGLKTGDPDIVHQIATGHDIRTKKNNKEINFYSFATKYCNWHNRDNYAIYDSFVDKVLMAYKRKDKFSTFRQSDLKDFSKFKKIIEDFADHYNLTRHNLKEIDKFLWIYGKEKFPASYDKKE